MLKTYDKILCKTSIMRYGNKRRNVVAESEIFIRKRKMLNEIKKIEKKGKWNKRKQKKRKEKIKKSFNRG